jgi:hypothetical protein
MENAMDMACRPLTVAEMRALMDRLGWSLHFRDSAQTAFTFMQERDGVTIHCHIVLGTDGKWTHQFTHIPGVQMLVQLITHPASFPHPKFERWAKRFYEYTHACEAVARSH